VSDSQSAALVLRVWAEDDPTSFRGRLTTTDTSPGADDLDDLTVAVASSPDELLEAIRAWIADFLDRPLTSVDRQ
jgi:hypothetical protein